jgi:nucleoside 2-deoxyribosyltransferase
VKIYLACTVRGNRGTLATARAIASALSKQGHEIVTGHLLEEDVDERESDLTERQVFERDLGWLEGCDVLVAEASGSSYGVGFEVGYVLGRASIATQSVVLVYDRRRTTAISRLIVGAEHPRCTTLGYASVAEAVAFVTGAVERFRAPA